MILRFTRRAQRDLLEILSYIETRSPLGAAHVAESLQESVAFIRDHPQGGIRTQNPALFVKIVADYPYKIFYRARGNVIEVVHIRHSARRPWSA